MDNEPFKKNSRHLLLHSDILSLAEKEQHNARVVVRVARRIAKLVRDSVQAGVATAVVKLHELLRKSPSPACVGELAPSERSGSSQWP
jgi:hypothetical protein